MSIAVIYVRWPADEKERLLRFIESYRNHPAGEPHDLVISEGDETFDIGTYMRVGQAVQHNYICCLNSYSEILVDGWLGKMAGHKLHGLVGATGSLETMDLVDWPAMPNPHIRTTGFLIKRSDFMSVVAQLKTYWPKTKQDCWAFESGPSSLTKTMLSYGLNPVVVGKDGVAYPNWDWQKSKTYRSGAQENLLIADHKTCEYEWADEDKRKELRKITWGKDAAE